MSCEAPSSSGRDADVVDGDTLDVAGEAPSASDGDADEVADNGRQLRCEVFWPRANALQLRALLAQPP